MIFDQGLSNTQSTKSLGGSGLNWPSLPMSRRARTRSGMRVRRSRSPFETAPLGIIICGNGYTEPNAAACVLFGRDRLEFGSQCPLHMAPEFQPSGKRTDTLRDELLSAARLGPKDTFWRFLRKDGVPFDTQITLAPDPRNPSQEFILYVRDVSSERFISGRLEMLSRAVEQVAAMIMITDTDGNVEYVNSSFTEVTGYKARDVIGKRPPILRSDAMTDEAHQELWRALRDGQVWKGQLRNRRANGELFWIEATISPIREENGIISHFLAVGRDVTEQKATLEESERLRHQLHHAHKMEALGTLAGGVAHDFNNILAAIYGFTHLAGNSLPPDSPVHAQLDRVINATQRGKDLVRQILTFSRKDEAKPEQCRLDTILREAAEFLRHTLPKSIAIQLEVPSVESKVMIEPGKLNQVIINLGTNAAHAMRDREAGVLSIGLNKVYVDNVQARRYHNLKTGQYLRISVADNGHGMDAATKARIFDPFFTTKPAGEGTGLGLSMVHGIITAAHGQISVYSELGVGTVFQLFLPVCENAVPAAQTDSNEVILHGEGRILYVDDEPEIAETQSYMLRELGYTLEAYFEPTQAFEAFAKNPQSYDLVITDQTMPNQQGIDFARKLTELRANIPILLTTGFSSNLSESDLRAAGIRQALLKPIFLSDLSKAVKEAIANSTSV